MSWRSFGQIIKIEVIREGTSDSTLQIEIDSIKPSDVFDFGANARVISLIKKELLASSR